MLKNLMKQINLSLLCLSFVFITNLNPSIVIAKTTSQIQVKTVADTTKPVIKLNSAATINVTYGSSYVDAGATVTDNKDTNLIATVTFTLNNTAVTSINTKIPGTYIIHYNAKDSAGNKASEVTRTVIVGSATTKASAPVVSTPAAITIKDFGAHSIDEVGYSTFDSSAAINKAIQYATANKITLVDFGSGRYYAKSIGLESNITYFSTQGVELIAEKNIELYTSIISGHNIENVKIQNITLNGNWNVISGNIELIALYNCSNVSIEECYLHENYYLGILLTACSHITVKNSRIYDTDCGIITMGDASNYLIFDSNEIYGGKIQESEPISIYNSVDKGLSHDITITNNILHDKANASGILVINATNVTVSTNTIYNCAVGISTENVDNITINKNLIHDCIYTGLKLQCSNSLVSANTIKDIKGAGIWFIPNNLGTYNNDNTISQNIVSNILDVGIRLEASTNCIIDNNTILDTRDICMTYANIQITGASNDSNTIQNNVNLGNTINKAYSILIYIAKNTTIKNNISTITDQGIGTILINNTSQQ